MSLREAFEKTTNPKGGGAGTTWEQFPNLITDGSMQTVEIFTKLAQKCTPIFYLHN